MSGLPRRTPGASGSGPRPGPQPADHGAAREALLIAAASCEDASQAKNERDAAMFALQATGQIVRRCWELAHRWAGGALRLQHDDPEAAAMMAMASAELQDVIAGHLGSRAASWPVPEDELARWRRSKGRQA